jgi:hypothetical protein
VLAGETPTILSQESELCAIPATLGATLVVLAQVLHLGVGGGVVAAVAVPAAFALRLLAIWRNWHAPRPLWRSKPDGGTPAAAPRAPPPAPAHAWVIFRRQADPLDGLPQHQVLYVTCHT